MSIMKKTLIQANFILKNFMTNKNNNEVKTGLDIDRQNELVFLHELVKDETLEKTFLVVHEMNKELGNDLITISDNKKVIEYSLDKIREIVFYLGKTKMEHILRKDYSIFTEDELKFDVLPLVETLEAIKYFIKEIELDTDKCSKFEDNLIEEADELINDYSKKYVSEYKHSFN